MSCSFAVENILEDIRYLFCEEFGGLFGIGDVMAEEVFQVFEIAYKVSRLSWVGGHDELKCKMRLNDMEDEEE